MGGFVKQILGIKDPVVQAFQQASPQASQEAVIERQEAAQAKQQTELAQRAQASTRARRGGGLRMLLSGEETGLGSNSKLGGGA